MWTCICLNISHSLPKPCPDQFKNMQALSLARYFFQAIAFAIFAYQMIVALDKYVSFATFPSVETKGIADMKLPDLFVCLKQKDMFDIRKSLEKFQIGYLGFLYGYDELRNSEFGFVSWEGNTEIPYKNLTRLLFNAIDEEDWISYGSPINNWNDKIGKALNIYCIVHDKIKSTHVLYS